MKNVKENLIPNFSRMVLPFTINEKNSFSPEDLVDSSEITISQKNFPLLEIIETESITRFFLPHVEEYLSNSGGENQYVHRWKFTNDAVKRLFSFSGGHGHLKFEMNDYKTEFEINCVEIYFFNSQVGFLIIECALKNIKSNTDLLNFNYYLRYLIEDYCGNISLIPGKIKTETIDYLSRNGDKYNDKFQSAPDVFNRLHKFSINKEGQVSFTETVTILDLFKSILNHLFGIKNYEIFLKDQVMIYSYILLDSFQNENEKYKYLFRMRRLFNNKYKPSILDVSIDSPEVIPTFENITFGISLEGSAALVENSDNPFFSQTISTVRTNYFIMYIMALHERIALLHFRKKIERIIPPNELRAKSKRKVMDNEIRRLRDATFNFSFNGVFSQLTNSSAYERVYQAFRENMQLTLLSNEIRQKTHEIDELITQRVNAKRDKSLFIITVIGFILAPISLLFGFLGMNITEDIVIKSLGISYSPYTWLSFVQIGSGVFIITILIYLWLSYKSKE